MSATQEVGEIFGNGSGPAHAMMRSPTVLIASVALWGMNIFYYRMFGINYAKVLKHDVLLLEAKENELSSSQSQSDHNSGKRHRGTESSIIQNDSILRSNSNGEIGKALEYASDDEEYYYEDEELESPEVANAAVTWDKLVWFSMSLLFLLHSTYFVWIDVLGGNQLGAVLAFYGVVTFAVVFPLPSTRWLRKASVIVLQRCFELVNPRCSCVITDALRPVPFVDVFFADAMCSLSKVFFDWGMLFHLLSHYPHPVPPSPYNILIPTACAAVPFLIRARQCLVMWSYCKLQPKVSHDFHKRLTHLANALKYATSVFPLSLSAYQKTIDPKRAEKLEKYLILLLVINTLYALYWDIVHDWGMMQKSPISTLCAPSKAPQRKCWHIWLRPRLRYGVAMSAIILIADSVLRFSWMLRFYHRIFPSADSFVLCTQFLEVFRRAIWNLLRIEWENFKQGNMRQSSNQYSNNSANEDEKSSFLPQPSVQMRNILPQGKQSTA
ncbi:hypothetical protein MPSEU_000333400 [Mayamaea pseudoterrestris]|nr:hypothetical protein MPSEU_000333400 [Mayamaea pseudoterrestris]